MPGNMSRAAPTPQHVHRDQHGRVDQLHWSHDGPTAAHSPAGGRWLLASDGSPPAVRAAAELARLATAGLQVAVDIVAVHGWLSREAAESEFAERGWSQAIMARDIVLGAGVAVDVHAVMGDPADTIMMMSVKLGSAGIVLGARGLGAVEGILLGSVASRLVREAKVPVLVVH